MVRWLTALLLLALPAFADARAEFVAAKRALGEADFGTLDPDERDRLFQALLGWDNPEVGGALKDLASRYGAYIDDIETRLDELNKKAAAFTDRVALRDLEVGLRNSYLRKIHQAEAEWRRALATQDLLGRLVGSLQNGKAVNFVLRTFAGHPTWRVRQLLADACSHWHRLLHDDVMSRRLFAALKRMGRDQEPRVRVAVARALVAFKRMEAYELIKGALSDPDWRVRAAAVKSLKAVRTSEAVGLLIQAMQKEEGRLKDDINKALKELTGKDLVFAEAWANWWHDVEQTLPAPGSEAGAGIAPTKPPERKPGFRFYGIPTQSQRICYIIDVSGSMKNPVEPLRNPVTGKRDRETRAAGKTRMEVAKNELKRAVSNLSAKAEFTIVFFNHAVQVWRPQPVKATAANKKDALNAIDAAEPKGATYTLGALRNAFRIAGSMVGSGKTKREGAGIDTIFVLSDGGPTTNKLHDPKPMDPDPILESVRRWNKDTGIVIHTIAVHALELGTYFLQQLAAQNGGVFVERKR